MTINVIDILLIEDNVDDIELTREALRAGKIANNLTVIRDGQEAMKHLFGNGDPPLPPERFPKLILLDLRLPKVDGIDVLRRIKKEPVLCRVPVVVLTTSKRDEDIVRSYDLGVNSYIQKPVLFDKFVETVKTLELYWVLTNTPPPYL
ncbi:MAG TPA: response regulator [Nitrospirales bacterium]|nr:response regulator [Nitrospirales bacterium]